MVPTCKMTIPNSPERRLRATPYVTTSIGLLQCSQFETGMVCYGTKSAVCRIFGQKPVQYKTMQCIYLFWCK